MATGSLPIYRVTVVERTTKAVNYPNRGGATKIDFLGIPLLAKAHGEATVEGKQGYIEIEVEFRELQPATAYGPEYLTYVMWAVTPEGRATKAGHTPIGTAAREAVQMAEDPRIITVKKIAEEELANERQAGVEREAPAESRRAAAQSETERIGREAEGARIASQMEAERVKRQHDTQIAAAQVESDRIQRESDSRLAAAQAETDRAKQENETLATTAQEQADRLKQENATQLATAQAETDRLTRENEAQRVAAMLGSLGCPYTCSFCIDAAVPYKPMEFDGLQEDLLKKFSRPMVAWHDPNFGVRF